MMRSRQNRAHNRIMRIACILFVTMSFQVFAQTPAKEAPAPAGWREYQKALKKSQKHIKAKTAKPEAEKPKQ